MGEKLPADIQWRVRAQELGVMSMALQAAMDDLIREANRNSIDLDKLILARMRVNMARTDFRFAFVNEKDAAENLNRHVDGLIAFADSEISPEEAAYDPEDDKRAAEAFGNGWTR